MDGAVRVRRRLADSFLGGGRCVVALGGAGAWAGFSESRRRLGLTVDRLVPGFLLGCPLQTGGSIASTGTSALFHPQLVRTGLTIKTFIARETRTFARRAFASCIVTVRKTIACQLNRLALGVLMPMRHSSCWRSQGGPSNKNPPHNWPVRRGRLLNLQKRIL